MKMGWREGSGLGKIGNEGLVEPLHSVIVANDSQLGLGKVSEYNTVVCIFLFIISSFIK